MMVVSSFHLLVVVNDSSDYSVEEYHQPCSYPFSENACVYSSPE